MSERAKLKVAAVGLGWVSQNRHIPTILKNRDCELFGLIDRHAGRAHDVARRWSVPHYAEASSLSHVSWIDDVDAVVIGASPFCHHNLAAEALQMGKHVLTEKPFTMTPDEADNLIHLRDDSGKQLCVVHNFQFARSTSNLLYDIESGRIGTIQSLEAVQFGNPKRRLPSWFEDLPLGLFYDESPHLLYLLRKLAPARLTLEHALVHRSTLGTVTPATVSAHFSFRQEGVAFPARMSLNFESPVSEWYLIVHGSKRLGIVDLFRDIYISLPNDGEHVASTIIRTSLVATSQHWVQTVTSGVRHLTGQLSYGNDQVLRLFVSSALGGVRPIGIDAEDAREVQALQHEIVDRAVVI